MLDAFARLEHRHSRGTFDLAGIVTETLAGDPGFAESTIRTHVATRVCANGPDHHGTVHTDLERVDLAATGALATPAPVEPNHLAAELGVTGNALRAWLRRTYPRSPLEHQTRWQLTQEQADAARRRFTSPSAPHQRACNPAASGGRRAGSDESYVLDLCDEVLGEPGLRQHRFDWLRGDPGANGSRVPLPVDAYYPGAGAVVEYRERQHDEPVAHFD